MKKIVSILLVSLQFLYTPSVASAISAPEFTSCESISGVPSVAYSDGTHGVAGDSATYTGSDEVYYLNSNQALQCLCSDISGGIQSNWWKVAGISSEEIKVFTKTGWVYIPDGSLWGLDQSPYLVQNKKFSCSARGGGVLSSSGQVLGVSTLAATGTQAILFTLIVIGLILLLLTKRVGKKHQ